MPQSPPVRVAPIRTPIVAENGQLTPSWQRYFADLTSNWEGGVVDGGGTAGPDLYETRIILGDDALAVGSDVCVNRYQFLLEPGEVITWVEWAITAKTAPTGSSFIVVVRTSTDSGGSWSVLTTVTLPVGTDHQTGSSFALPTSDRGDYLRVDITQVGSAVAGGQIEIVLRGSRA